MDALFKRRISDALGLVPLPSWEIDLPAAVEQICKSRGITPAELEARFEIEPGALRELAGLLTVGETYFLREPQHFELIVRHVLGRYERGGPLLVWSAGCASGEEPYSIAMSIARAAPHMASAVRIIASDISRESLDKARRGLYRSWSFRATPPWVAHDFFRAHDDPSERGALILSEAIRGSVELFEESIQSRIWATPPESLDVIVFRNVSIYLDAATLTDIFAGFQRILRSDGLLVVGAADARPTSDRFRAIPGDVPGVYVPATQTGRGAAPAFFDASAFDPLPPPAPLPAFAPRARRQSWSAMPAVSPEAIAASSPGSDGVKRPAPVLTRSDRPGPLKVSPERSDRPERPSAAPPRSASRALELADKGDLQGALEVISRQIAGAPDEPSGYLVRGQIRLAANAVEEAIADLRRVVFMRPTDRIARYWLSAALKAAGLMAQAASQLAELKRRLQEAAAHELLEDGATSVSELQTTVEHELEALR